MILLVNGLQRKTIKDLEFLENYYKMNWIGTPSNVGCCQGGIAQLVERVNGIHKVDGSIPFASIWKDL